MLEVRQQFAMCRPQPAAAGLLELGDVEPDLAEQCAVHELGELKIALDRRIDVVLPHRAGHGFDHEGVELRVLLLLQSMMQKKIAEPLVNITIIHRTIEVMTLRHALHVQHQKRDG